MTERTIGQGAAWLHFGRHGTRSSCRTRHKVITASLIIAYAASGGSRPGGIGGRSRRPVWLPRAFWVVVDEDNVLERFKANGWYLDDLVLEPVNWLERSERRRKWREAQDGLAARIKVYKPRAIVSVLKAIEDTVEAAAKAAGCDAELFAVPFPGMGQQVRFHEAMAKIMPRLPREAAKR